MYVIAVQRDSSTHRYFVSKTKLTVRSEQRYKVEMQLISLGRLDEAL